MKAPVETETLEELQILRHSMPRVDSNTSNGDSSSSALELRVSVPAAKHYAWGTISAHSLDDFNQDSYQNLLGKMVSRIIEHLLSGSFNPNSPFLQGARQNSKRSQLVSKHDVWPSEGALVPSSEVNEIRIPQEHPVTSVSALLTPYIFSVSVLHSKVENSYKLVSTYYLAIPRNPPFLMLKIQVLKVITKYVAAIDGGPKQNFYNDTWVLWAMKSPLLAHLAIFTALCYQSEAQNIPPAQSTVVLGYKLKSISLLNQMLRNKETSLSLESITAVVFLAINEWYWCSYDNVEAHMRGLREMARLQDGLGDPGINWFL